MPSQVMAVAIGGSAGGFVALRTILTALPAELPFPLLVVLHQLPGRTSLLPGLIATISKLHVSECLDKEQVVASTIYVAPPDYHLLVERGGSIALSMDEPEHFSRPSIDVLFETAAAAYRDRLVGVLLSGASEDGARGLEEIHRAGGRAIVQDPQSAEVARMPAAAIARCRPDAILPPQGIGEYLAALAGERPT